jgi:hypothetical protein
MCRVTQTMAGGGGRGDGSRAKVYQ